MLSILMLKGCEERGFEMPPVQHPRDVATSVGRSVDSMNEKNLCYTSQVEPREVARPPNMRQLHSIAKHLCLQLLIRFPMSRVT